MCDVDVDAKDQDAKQPPLPLMPALSVPSCPKPRRVAEDEDERNVLGPVVHGNASMANGHKASTHTTYDLALYI